ncbi:hypothetical protein [Parachitinimonas caeni]|uniref:Uncharacterized protein n=1 Tax=Parachitinimonas caeni TaxID=3031301 RepID=A0ABT7E2A7_9NEIS|nr:hypothetical protein [Parachitinimonas caeni]MDK2126451.1 hypothetical protein [Parachitinimonas caeni]
MRTSKRLLCTLGIMLPLLSVQIGQAGGLSRLLKSDAETVWQCPPGQSCAEKPDYRALYLKTDDTELYLSFSGALKDRFDAATLNKEFRFGDLYLHGKDGIIALHAEPGTQAEARIKFLPASAGRVKAIVTGKRYRLQTDGKPSQPGAECKTDDVAGFCREEKRISKPIEIKLDIALPKL